MRLLVVEDNQALADNLEELFSGVGYQVSLVSDGRAALAAADLGFDLALIDLNLPDVSGTQLLVPLKQKEPDAELIVMTGNADLDSAIKALETAAFSYLTKPVSPDRLLLTVERARERVELRRRSRDLQAALAASEAKQREILSAVGAVILEIGAEHRVLFASPASLEIFGLEPEALIGRDLVELVVLPDEHELCRMHLADAFAGNPHPHETFCRGPEGSVRAVNFRWTRPTGLGARPGIVYGVGTDVTQQRELERRIRASEQLAAAGTLTAGLAHEIRNPLNSASLQLALLQRLLKRLAEPERAKLVPTIDLVQGELSRLDALLEDFLRFARPREYELRPLDLASLLDDVLKLETARASAAKIELKSQVEGPLGLRGDADALKQVLVNLIKNALEAAKKQVQVVAKRIEGRIRVEVLDDGAGIPAALHERIFEPFFSTKSSGTGLGLPIVYTIVRAHGGSVQYRRRKDGGTCALLEFPAG